MTQVTARRACEGLSSVEFENNVISHVSVQNEDEVIEPDSYVTSFSVSAVTRCAFRSVRFRFNFWHF